MPSKVKPNRKSGTASTASDLKKLIEAAKKQPGVAEVMEVYQQYQVAERTANAYQRLLGVKRIVSLSDGSKNVSSEE